MLSRMMEDGIFSVLPHSSSAECPHLPQTFLLEWTPRKTPGPQVGQNSPFLTNSPSSTEYFECLPLGLGPSPISTHSPLTLFREPLLQWLLPLVVSAQRRLSVLLALKSV